MYLVPEKTSVPQAPASPDFQVSVPGISASNSCPSCLITAVLRFLFFNAGKSAVISVVFPEFLIPLTASISCFFCVFILSVLSQKKNFCLFPGIVSFSCSLHLESTTKALLPLLLHESLAFPPAYQSDSYILPLLQGFHWNEVLTGSSPSLHP